MVSASSKLRLLETIAILSIISVAILLLSTKLKKVFVGEVLHMERNVKVCLLEQDFPVGCQFKETFGLNFPEAHRDLH